ncbi:Fc.00g042030.m01.CDS01 [Cosmosporella sp. VM-42]
MGCFPSRARPAAGLDSVLASPLALRYEDELECPRPTYYNPRSGSIHEEPGELLGDRYCERPRLPSPLPPPGGRVHWADNTRSAKPRFESIYDPDVCTRPGGRMEDVALKWRPKVKRSGSRYANLW